ncbi:MAG: MoaD/ThiS family protein [Promethearchaeota archaeon]|jgi:MoaD family protein
MIDIKIAFLSLLADITGKDAIILSIDENSNIKDIIKKLNLKFGKEFENTILNSPDVLSKYIILILNGKDIRSFDGLDTIIHQGDEISFLPAIAGG